MSHDAAGEDQLEQRMPCDPQNMSELGFHSIDLLLLLLLSAGMRPHQFHVISQMTAFASVCFSPRRLYQNPSSKYSAFWLFLLKVLLLGRQERVRVAVV